MVKEKKDGKYPLRKKRVNPKVIENTFKTFDEALGYNPDSSSELKGEGNGAVEKSLNELMEKFKEAKEQAESIISQAKDKGDEEGVS